MVKEVLKDARWEESRAAGAARGEQPPGCVMRRAGGGGNAAGAGGVRPQLDFPDARRLHVARSCRCERQLRDEQAVGVVVAEAPVVLQASGPRARNYCFSRSEGCSRATQWHRNRMNGFLWFIER